MFSHKDLDNQLNKIAEDNDFSGTILISQNGDIKYKKACGYACKSFNIKNELDTKFNVASVRKIFTGVAIAQLVEKGAVQFEDKLSLYIDEEWLDKSVSENIAIENLLTHTSGLGDYFSDAYNQSYYKTFEDVGDYKDIIKKATLSFVPGTNWSYSNMGFLVLGVLIEKITNKKFSEYITEEIFNAANMINSNFSFIDEPISNRATGYYQHNGKWRCNYIKPVVRGTGSGGCYSTVIDLVHFFEALNSFKIVPKEMKSIILSAKPNLHSPNYGYGFFVDENKVYHGGNGTGIEAYVAHYLSSGCTMAILSNCSNFPISSIISIADEIFIG